MSRIAWIRLPPMPPSKPSSQRISRMTRIVQSTLYLLRYVLSGYDRPLPARSEVTEVEHDPHRLATLCAVNRVLIIIRP